MFQAKVKRRIESLVVQKLSSFVFSALYVFKLIDYCKSSAGESIRAIHAMFNSVIVFFFLLPKFLLERISPHGHSMVSLYDYLRRNRSRDER